MANGFAQPSLDCRVIVVAGGNLFSLAATYLGDATQWNRIAAENNLTDFILPATPLKLRLPYQKPSVGNGGILGL